MSSIVRTKLSQNALDVALYRFLGDSEPVRDNFVRATGRYDTEHLSLAG